MDILKRIWKAVVGAFVVIGGLFILVEIKRKRKIKSSTKAKLDSLSLKNIDYSMQLNGVIKRQDKLNKSDTKQAENIIRLEKEKNRIRDKIHEITKQKKEQREKILTVSKAVQELEKRYGK